MINVPEWYPLSIDANDHTIVRDAKSTIFATARGMFAAAAIVLIMNASVRRDFEIE
jgi:hypothetical protein